VDRGLQFTVRPNFVANLGEYCRDGQLDARFRGLPRPPGKTGIASDRRCDKNLYGYIGTLGTKYFAADVGTSTSSWATALHGARGQNLFVINGADQGMANYLQQPDFLAHVIGARWVNWSAGR